MLSSKTAMARRSRLASAAASLAVLGAPGVAHAHGGYEALWPLVVAFYIGLPSAVVLLVVLSITAWRGAGSDRKSKQRWAAAADIISVACMVVYPLLTFPLVLSDAKAFALMVLCWLPLGGLGAWSIKRSRALR